MFKAEDYTCLNEKDLRELLSRDWERIFLTISYVIVCNAIGIFTMLYKDYWIYYPIFLIIGSVFVAVIYAINYACQEYGAWGIVLSIVISAAIVFILDDNKYGRVIMDNYQYLAFLSAFIMIYKFFIFPIAEIHFVKKNLSYKLTVDFIYVLKGIITGIWTLSCNCLHVVICFYTSFLLIVGICFGVAKHD